MLFAKLGHFLPSDHWTAFPTVRLSRLFVRPFFPSFFVSLFLSSLPSFFLILTSFYLHTYRYYRKSKVLFLRLVTLNDTPSLGRSPLGKRPVRRRDLYLTTHNTHDRHPCPRWDSNAQSQQASGLRPRFHRDRPFFRSTMLNPKNRRR